MEKSWGKNGRTLNASTMGNSQWAMDNGGLKAAIRVSLVLQIGLPVFQDIVNCPL